MLSRVLHCIQSLLIMLVSVAYIPQSWAADLHAILLASDQDTSIAASVSADLERGQREAQAIAAATGLNLRLTLFNRDKFNKEHVVSTLNALQLAAEDVVFFYYAGHGARLQKTPTLWPDMVLAQQFSDSAQLYSFNDAIQLLRQKSPRFLFAAIDACNNYLDPAPEAARRAPAGSQVELYRHLFNDYSGMVLVSATSPGEFAMGNANGGKFSQRLFEAFAQAPSGADWDQLSELVSQPITTTQSKGEPNIQTPQWLLNAQILAAPTPQPTPPAPQPAPNTEAECSLNDYLRQTPGCE